MTTTVSAPKRGRRVLAALLAVAVVLLPLALIHQGVLLPGAGVVALLVLFLIFFRAADRHGPGVLLVFALVAFISTVGQQPLLRLGSESRQADEGARLAREWQAGGGDLPNVLHLVFDEFMSTGAIDPALPGGPETRQALLDLAARHRLRLFDSVYSRYFFSGVAIPDLMQAGYLGETASPTIGIDVRPAANAYFVDMARRGYRTAVFQSAVIDFCAPESVALCEVFESFDPAGATVRHGTLASRVRDLSETLFRSLEPSYTARFGRWLTAEATGLDRQARDALGAEGRYDVQGFGAWFDRLEAFALGAPRGSHIFGHLLVPHAPYLLDEECTVLSEPLDAGYYLATRRDVGEFETERAAYYARYFRQVRCVAKRLDRLLTRLEAEPAWRDALVIIHGDHGSRISRGNLRHLVQSRDFVDNYATFFAVRDPRLEPGLDCTFTSLPQMFRRVVNGYEETDPELPLPVMVDTGGDGQAREPVPMPAFGCADGS